MGLSCSRQEEGFFERSQVLFGCRKKLKTKKKKTIEPITVNVDEPLDETSDPRAGGRGQGQNLVHNEKKTRLIGCCKRLRRWLRRDDLT